jgi:hypothetical protein
MSAQFPVPMPDKPGTYELRYVALIDLKTKATKVVTTSVVQVTPGAKITVKSPSTAAAGRRFEVTVTGTPGMGTLILIVKPEVKTDDVFTKVSPGERGVGQVAPGRAKSMVIAPRTPGTYELRLMRMDRSARPPGFKVLVRKPIVITPK